MAFLLMKTQRHLLLSVAGISPAVITETLFGLYYKHRIIRGDVHIITTSRGRDSMVMHLAGENSQLDRFNQEYQADWRLREIDVIQDEEGNPLPDLRSSQDNFIVADLILRRVREFTENDDIILHASLAGGRKTMGYYLGQSMSWLARPDDDLSHVLIPENLEQNRQFFFPEKNDFELHPQIDYASLPLVKMGRKFQELLKDDKVNKENKPISYRETVELFQNYLKDQSGEATIRLNLPTRTLFLENTAVVTLSPMSMALYLFFCEYANNQTGNEAFEPTGHSFRHRNNLADCLRRCQVKIPEQAKGLSALLLERSRWPDHWREEGDAAYANARKKDMNKPLSDLKSDFPEYTFKLIHKGRKKTASLYYVSIDPDRLKIES